MPGTGWVMADPADVRKKMLNEKIEKVEDFKKWSGDELLRIALNRRILRRIYDGKF